MKESAAILVPRFALRSSWNPAVRRTGTALATVAWISGMLFGFYILAFYGGALVDGAASQWNSRTPLPRQFDRTAPWANIGIGVHFLTGAILLLLGPVQFIAAIRARWPSLHRWTGRTYTSAALLTGIGGLAFILAKGTIGGAPMDVAFALYGVLLIVAAFNTARHARARRLDAHRAWAVRLFALAIGSWLYRIEYTAWRVFAGGAGHTATFDGPFDTVMLYFFYVPNLLLAEAYLRAGRSRAGRTLQGATALLLAGATAVLAVLTYFLALRAWGPPIVDRLTGA